MIVLHANDEVAANKINDYIDNGFNVFMLIYMEGCGPCNAVRPEWADFHKTLEQPYLKNNKLVVVDVNKDYSHLIKKINNKLVIVIYLIVNCTGLILFLIKGGQIEGKSGGYILESEKMI